MRTVKYKSWVDFRRFLTGYAEQTRERRGQLAFRGHSDSGWRLESTLDRENHFPSDEERNLCFDKLLSEFQKEAMRLISSQANLPVGDAFQLLARHHGVPSPILDWTESPYIASYFAFEEARLTPRHHVALWVLDRATFPAIEGEIELIDDLELIRFNRRALQQRGLFTRVLTITRTVEEILSDSLTKITIPSISKANALADLDEMGINSASLFADLDGAARTARYRIKP